MSSPPPQSKKYFNWALFNRLAKIVVVLVILGLGLQSIYVFWKAAQRQEVAEVAEVAEPVEELPSDVDLESDPKQIFSDLTSGNWRFNESDWDFRILSASAVSAASSVPSTIRQREPDFDDEAIINQFRQLGVTPKPVGKGFDRWESQGMGFTMTLFTHDGVVQMMRTQLPVEQGISIVEAFPRSKAEDANRLMLPLVDGAKQTAARVEPNGRVTSAIIHLNAEKQIDIRSHWKENGWEVTPTSEFGSDDLSKPLANSKFRCVKDGQEIEATFISENDEPQAVIILTLLPSGIQ